MPTGDEEQAGRDRFYSAWVVWMRRLDGFLSLCRSALRYWCLAMIWNNGRYLTGAAFMNSIGQWGEKKNKANCIEMSLLGVHQRICEDKKRREVIWVFLLGSTVWNWLMIAVKREADTPAGGHAAIDLSFCTLLTFFFFSVRRWHGKSIGNR